MIVVAHDGIPSQPDPLDDPAYPDDTAQVLRREAASPETARANRRWWDAAADAYQAEHGPFLGDAKFVWGPEGLDEADAHLLGGVAGRSVLEIGCGAGQCGRWLLSRGAKVVGLEISQQQLRHSARIDRRTGFTLPVVQADAQHLPFTDGSFDLICSSYGAFPFLADAPAALRETARVLRRGGRLVFSVAHPLRWCFLDDPKEEGLVAVHSYFDRRAYVEEDQHGAAAYIEHHRTVGDWIRAIANAGLQLVDLVEPQWPQEHDGIWGGWSPLRGRIIPGTAIFACTKG